MNNASDQMTRYQRKLIPVNIVVMVLCVVAMVSILFLPLLQIDVGKLVAAVPLPENGETTQGAQDDTPEIDPAELFGALDGVKLSFSTLTLMRVTAGINFLDNFFDMLTEVVTDAVDDVAEMVFPLVLKSFDLGQLGVTEEDIDNFDASRVVAQLKELETTQDKDATIAKIVDVFAEELGITDLPAEERDSLTQAITDIYDTTVEAADKFTLEACICVNASHMISDDEDAPVYTTFSELIRSYVSGSEQGAELTATIGKATGAVKYSLYAMLFFAGVWFVLFVFALVHTFTKNKRFTMWYVKIFGGVPCLVFWLVPTVVLPKVLTSLVTDAAALTAVQAMTSAITSLAWIGGLCYVLLWLVSIFWAFPIKRKIRKMKKEGYGEGPDLPALE